MKVGVLFFERFRDIAQVRERAVSLEEGDTLNDLIAALIDQYDDGFRHLMETSRGLRILVNGRENELLNGRDTGLAEGDMVTFLPLVFGG